LVVADRVLDNRTVEHVAGDNPDLARVCGMSACEPQRIGDLLARQSIVILEGSVPACQRDPIRLDVLSPTRRLPTRRWRRPCQKRERRGCLTADSLQRIDVILTNSVLVSLAVEKRDSLARGIDRDEVRDLLPVVVANDQRIPAEVLAEAARFVRLALYAASRSYARPRPLPVW
jgi:hypothetical protein